MSAIINNTFNEIVFTDRNKLFGSYFLRNKYSTYILRSVILAITLFSVALASPLIYNKYFKSQEVVEDIEVVEVKLEDIPSIDPSEPPPPPPPKIEIPQIETIKFLPPVVKEDKEVIEEEVPPTEEELKDAVASTSTHEGEKGLNELIEQAPAQPAPVEEKEEEIVSWVEEMPEFTGGDLVKFLNGQIASYPPDALKHNIQGKVYVEFIVNKDGSMSDIKVVKGLGYGCDEEALRAVKATAGQWRPGRGNGVPKKVKKRVSLVFKLAN